MSSALQKQGGYLSIFPRQIVSFSSRPRAKPSTIARILLKSAEQLALASFNLVIPFFFTEALGRSKGSCIGYRPRKTIAMNFRAFLLGLLFISVAFAAEKSQQSDKKSIESIDSVLAVVGKVFVYSVPNEGGHKDTFKVSDDL